MATYSVGTTGAKKLTAQLRALSRDVDEAAKDACFAAGKVIEGEARRLIISTPKSGKTYKSAGVGRYRASAAGEAPANRTGALQSSIDTRKSDDGATVGIHDGTSKDGKNTLAYAWRLEFGFVGADSAGRFYGMAARPFLRPAINNQRDMVSKIINSAVRRKIKEAQK
jgi:HK97 gp10 family phage protein